MLRTGWSGAQFPVRGKEFFSSPKRLYQLCGKSCFIFREYEITVEVVKRPEREVNHAPPSSIPTEECVQLSTPPTPLKPSYRGDELLYTFQYSETYVMYFLFNLLRIKGLYMFPALLAHPQETLHRRHLVYCLSVLSVGC
jgi:hypothetical protein